MISACVCQFRQFSDADCDRFLRNKKIGYKPTYNNGQINKHGLPKTMLCSGEVVGLIASHLRRCGDACTPLSLILLIFIRVTSRIAGLALRSPQLASYHVLLIFRCMSVNIRKNIAVCTFFIARCVCIARTMLSQDFRPSVCHRFSKRLKVSSHFLHSRVVTSFWFFRT